jgi:hypothetical protein
MTKGIIFNLIHFNNGFLITFFTIFKFGLARDDDGYGPYSSLILGIRRLEFSFAITWRNNEKKENIKEPKTPIASA